MAAEPINTDDSTYHTPAASQAPCEPSDPAACPTISAQQIHTRASEPISTPATIQTAPPFARASSTCSVRNRGNEQNPSHQRPSAARPSSFSRRDRSSSSLHSGTTYPSDQRPRFKSGQ
ncbi:hypothetical protein ACLOJK_038554 [Asimina triloba]